ncbi:MAG: hypothetical protein GWP10_21170 [Nitrospiraceae bacterium]|nr:hypothetical protein [Nitrospiraceae bacterium]
MPALSFGKKWLDALLRGDKKQTTRPQTARIKEGAVCTIYNQQRQRIVNKPLRKLTAFGNAEMHFRNYQNVPDMLEDGGFYHAHLLGKVEIIDVHDIHPCEMAEAELKAWAVADGFKGFHPQTVPPDRLYDGANMWFQRMGMTGCSDSGQSGGGMVFSNDTSIQR